MKKFIKILVLLCGITSTSLVLAQEDSTIIFEVNPGASAQSVANSLEQLGVVKYGRLFSLYLRFTDKAHQIKPGEYALNPKASYSQLADSLTSGKLISYSYTLVPGDNLKQVKQKLKKLPKLKQTLNPQAWKDLEQELNNGESLEGWLLPETYYYHKGETDRQLVIRAFDAMRLTLMDNWKARDGGLPLKNPYEALILASIIEKETGAAHEREMIAGVFTRRLQKGMRLQTDPTVIYGMGDKYQGHIGRAGLDTYTPYNTYKIRGLPPTPIAMPSKESVYAALHPDNSDKLYFVAKGKGEHYFSATLKEHNKAVRRYIIQRKTANDR